MDKWECNKCKEEHESNHSCILYFVLDNLKPDTCPYSGTDCNWQKVEDKDNE